MSSDSKKYGAIDEGIYNGNYDINGKRGKLSSHWVLEHRGAVRTLDGQINPNAPSQILPNGEGYKNGIFIHSTNQNGFAGVTSEGAISAGCLLIAPGDWKGFNSAMDNAQSFKVRVSRSALIRQPLMGVTGIVPGLNVINQTILY